MKAFLKTIQFSILLVALASESHAMFLKCDLIGPETAIHNRFQAQAYLQVDEKGEISAELSGTLTKAGVALETSVLENTAVKGRLRRYSPGVLAKQEVILIQLAAEGAEKVISLKAVAGLSGPQSILVINSQPYRAECKLH